MSLITTTQEFELEQVDFTEKSPPMVLTGDGDISSISVAVYQDDEIDDESTVVTIDGCSFFVEQLEEVVRMANNLSDRISGD